MDATPSALRGYAARDRLRDGRVLRLRAIRSDDKAALLEGLHHLSEESAYFRFFRAKHDASPQELAYFADVDFAQHVALVATVEDAPSIVGVGRYIVCAEAPARAAEVAFAVDDAHQGLGIAGVLLRHLTEIARAAGIVEFRADVLFGNRKMMRVFTRSGLPQERKSEGGVVNLRLSLRIQVGPAPGSPRRIAATAPGRSKPSGDG